MKSKQFSAKETMMEWRQKRQDYEMVPTSSHTSVHATYAHPKKISSPQKTEQEILKLEEDLWNS